MAGQIDTSIIHPEILERIRRDIAIASTPENLSETERLRLKQAINRFYDEMALQRGVISEDYQTR